MTQTRLKSGYSGMFDCKGRTSVVTGGCGLIGKEIAGALAQFGAKVYVADLGGATLEKTADKIGALPLALDISDERSIRDAFRAITKSGKALDILVNCAYPRTEDWGNAIENIRVSSWNKNCADHMGGYFFASRAAAEVMKRHRSGSIINIASIYGMVGPDFGIYEGTSMTMPAAYSAIKGGIISFTRYIATYYAKYNVRVNSVSPGGVFNGQNPRFVKKYSDKTPLGRMALPQDVAGAVVFLAGEASSYITGCNIAVDGGWTAL